jgi:hypothetical protein
MPLPPLHQRLIDKKIISKKDLMLLRPIQQKTLDKPFIVDLILDGRIHLKDVLKFDFAQSSALGSQQIQAFMKQGMLSLKQVLNFDVNQTLAFENQGIVELIHQGWLTVDQVTQFGLQARTTFEYPNIRQLIVDRYITVAQALEFGPQQRNAFNTHSIRYLFERELISYAQVWQLETHHLTLLTNQVIVDLIATGRFLIEDLFVLEPRHMLLFDNPVILEMMFEHHMTPQDIIHREEELHRPTINDDQSTHHTSVHQSVSHSATRLNQRYSLLIEGNGLDALIEMLSSFIKNLSDGCFKHAVAKRCIKRITDINYFYTDSASQLSLRRLLALVFLAIHDANQRMGTLVDARNLLIDALYEIQRGYNLSEFGIDNGRTDASICIAGTFNKLLEKLQGIHPDVEINFMTKELASLKLPSVVREKAQDFIKNFTSPKTVSEFLIAMRLMNHIELEGVELIWTYLVSDVSKTMYAEFGRLYSSQEAEEFKQLIDAGRYAALNDLKFFQVYFEKSPGYHQFCKQVIHSSTIFN